MRRTFEYDDYPYGGDQFIALADSLRRRYPRFLCNVFAIPSAMRDHHWQELRKRSRWMRVCPHGFVHKRGECRVDEMWQTRMGLLDYVARDPLWTKCFKAPWYGYCQGFVEEAASMGFSLCIKTLQGLHYPTPDVRVWNIEDARISAGGFGERQSKHVEAHPVYGTQRAIKAARTEISRYNVRRWTRHWRRGDRWSFVDDLVVPLGVKLYLGCGPHVWDGWQCLDPRSYLDRKIVDWDFSRPIPYGGCRADVALTSHVFNYLADSEYVPACLEVWRVLRPGAVFRLAEDATDSGYVWRQPGQRSRGTGVIKSLPTKRKIVSALESVGFEVHDAKPGETLSHCKDVLQGDSRRQRWRHGHKYYLEAVKTIDIPDVKRVKHYDPRVQRNGELVLVGD